MKTKSAFLSVGFYVFAFFCSTIMVIPFFWTISTALKSADAIFLIPPSLIPSPVQWHNFGDALQLLPFPRLFLNSAIVSSSVTLITLAMCSMAAFAFARLTFRGNRALLVLYLASLLIPFSVTLIPSFIIVRALGWINSYVGLIIPVACGAVAFGTFLLRQFFISIPRELDEAAWMDGSGSWRIFLQIILPLGKPAIMTLGIYTFVINWNNLLWSLVVVSSEEMKTLTLGLATLTSTETFMPPWNQVMAATIMGILPVILVFIVVQRYFIQAMTLSGIKG